MNSVVYQKTIVPASAPGAEGVPTILYVTHEHNGYAVFIARELPEFHRWFRWREEAIEFGVQEAARRISVLATALGSGLEGDT